MTSHTDEVDLGASVGRTLLRLAERNERTLAWLRAVTMTLVTLVHVVAWGGVVLARPDAPQRLDELEAEMGALAVSGRAFFETFHSVRFEQAETQLEGRGAPHGLAGLGSHAALVIHPFDHAAREFREYEARLLESDLEPYDAGAHPPMLFVGPVLSNCQVAHFEMGAHAMDDLNFGADGREAPSFLDHLRRCIAHGGFPFWSFLRQEGIPTP